jgi:hypothetical protein
MQAWLEAFNSCDQTRIQAYVAKYQRGRGLQGQIAFCKHTGGFDVLSIEKSERLQIIFRVKDKASATTGLANIEVNDTDPASVVRFSLRGIPPTIDARP